MLCIESAQFRLPNAPSFTVAEPSRSVATGGGLRAGDAQARETGAPECDPGGSRAPELPRSIDASLLSRPILCGWTSLSPNLWNSPSLWLWVLVLF